ncbi:MAG: helix-turn-helix domain-containing protein [Deltaproteobacteria bacterium]|nr:helix-turn-helix domain-containing protein [Deltaproteobacteria bacterium]
MIHQPSQAQTPQAPQRKAEPAEDSYAARILIAVDAGAMSVAEAAALLGIHRTNVKRRVHRFKSSGARGLVHGLAGRRSNRAVAMEIVETTRASFDAYCRATRKPSVRGFYDSLDLAVRSRFSYATLARMLRAQRPTRVRARLVAGRCVVLTRRNDAWSAADLAAGPIAIERSGQGPLGVIELFRELLLRRGIPMQLAIVDNGLQVLPRPVADCMQRLCDALGVELRKLRPIERAALSSVDANIAPTDDSEFVPVDATAIERVFLLARTDTVALDPLTDQRSTTDAHA